VITTASDPPTARNPDPGDHHESVHHAVHQTPVITTRPAIPARAALPAPVITAIQCTMQYTKPR
jgi:hypothetical protein